MVNRRGARGRKKSKPTAKSSQSGKTASAVIVSQETTNTNGNRIAAALESSRPRLARCSHAVHYRGNKNPPRCNDGYGCDACLAIWRKSQGSKPAKNAKAPQPKLSGTSDRFNAADYVMSVARTQKSSGGCRVCIYPRVAKKLKEIFEEMSRQRVKISRPQIRADLIAYYSGDGPEGHVNFECSSEKFSEHWRRCLKVPS